MSAKLRELHGQVRWLRRGVVLLLVLDVVGVASLLVHYAHERFAP